MPRLNLRSVPLPSDPYEEAFRDAARDAGYALHINALARRARMPHLQLFKHSDRTRVVATFKSSREGLRWLEAEARDSAAWTSKERQA